MFLDPKLHQTVGIMNRLAIPFIPTLAVCTHFFHGLKLFTRVVRRWTKTLLIFLCFLQLLQNLGHFRNKQKSSRNIFMAKSRPCDYMAAFFS